MRTRLLLVNLVCFWSLALTSTLAAQPGSTLLTKSFPPTRFESISYAEALKLAERRTRLLMIFFSRPDDPADADMERRTWTNPSLAAYNRWHCIPIRLLARENPALLSRFKLKFDDCPAVVVVRSFSGAPALEATMKTERNPFGKFAPSWGPQSDIPDIHPTPINVLFQTDFALERIRAKDPMWALKHDEVNPEPTPPIDPDPLYQIGDDSAPAIRDPEGAPPRSRLEEAPNAGPAPVAAVSVDVFTRLDEAREAIGQSDLFRATGLYTWLWERAEQIDPCFAPVKRSALAGEMRSLALARPETHKRFELLRDVYNERFLWTTYDRTCDWFLLNSVLKEESETIAFLDLFVNDTDESSMLPNSDLAAYKLMVTRNLWNEPWSLGESPAAPESALGKERAPRPVVTAVTARVERLAAISTSPRPKSIDPEDWPKLDAFRRSFFLNEASRLHAACLRAGRENDAWAIADTLLRVRDDGLARHCLAATALATGEPRPKHLELLDQAANLGAPHPLLHDRIDRALKDPPPKPVEPTPLPPPPSSAPHIPDDLPLHPSTQPRGSARKHVP